jgi:hypothetical protein
MKADRGRLGASLLAASSKSEKHVFHLTPFPFSAVRSPSP